jgi:hypothetical protein
MRRPSDASFSLDVVGASLADSLRGRIPAPGGGPFRLKTIKTTRVTTGGTEDDGLG